MAATVAPYVIEQDEWFAFVRWLRLTYTDRDTVGSRLTEHLQATAGDRD